MAILATWANAAWAAPHQPSKGTPPIIKSNIHVPGATTRGSAAYHPARTKKPTGQVWQRGRSEGTAGSGNMQYHGGLVQHAPQVYIVFWGTWWDCSGTGCVDPGNGNGLAVERYLYDYWHGVGTGNDSLVQVDSQYTDTTGGHPSFGSSVWGTGCSTDGNGNCGWVAYQQDPPQAPTSQDIAGVAAWGADYFGVAGDADAQIIVVSPQGINPDGFPNAGFCAWHDSTADPSGNFVAYTNMPYLSDAGTGCGASSSMDGYSIVGGHEFSETVTDPALTGWCGGNTQTCAGSSAEIGDLCAWTHLFTEGLSTGSFAQQPLWDNATTSCQNSVFGSISSRGHSTKCVDDYRSSTANGAKVDLYSCNRTHAQSWVVFPDHSLRRYGSYSKVNTSKCIDIAGRKTADGTKIQLWSCTGRWNQKWSYDSVNHEWINPHTGKCLTDPGGHLANGTQLQLRTCRGSGSQQWSNV